MIGEQVLRISRTHGFGELPARGFLVMTGSVLLDGLAIIDWADASEQARSRVLSRGRDGHGLYGDEELWTAIRSIVSDVADRGDAALIAALADFDKIDVAPDSLKITETEFAAARAQLDAELVASIRVSIARSRAFNDAILQRQEWTQRTRVRHCSVNGPHSPHQISPSAPRPRYRPPDSPRWQAASRSTPTSPERRSPSSTNRNSAAWRLPSPVWPITKDSPRTQPPSPSARNSTRLPHHMRTHNRVDTAPTPPSP